MKKKVSFTATVRSEMEARFLSHTATKYDEVMLALFNETREQRETVCNLNLRISILEATYEPSLLSDQLRTVMYGKNIDITKAQSVSHDD